MRLRFGVKQTPCWVLKEQAPFCVNVDVVLDGHLLLVPKLPVVGVLEWCGGGWLFVENCTVDASIFVVKLLRADGGCLGTRSR